MSEKQSPFVLPKQFLNQLDEFSCSYYLTIVDHNGDFHPYHKADNSAYGLGLLTFTESHVGAIKHQVNQTIYNRILNNSKDNPEDKG